MQLFVLLGIALCLFVETSTKSVPSTENEAGTGYLSLTEHGNIDSKAAADECKCENGFCEKNNVGKWVCKCPPEWGLYSSTFCKKCDCGKDSNCTFLGILQIRKTCLCKVGYTEVDGTCKGDCSKNPCKNGGTCQVKNGEVTCQCKEDYGGEDCSIRTCQSDSNCMNGGKCGASNFCSCLQGTVGDFCEEISECKHMNCEPEARCTYDVERQQAMCSCENHELLFDSKQRKCRRPCYGDSDCRNGARCEENGRVEFCRCLNGTEGDFCEEVSECKGLNCGPDARCTYDTRRETAMCSCQNEDLVFDRKERRCKTCSCGIVGSSCEFDESGNKLCSCPDGFIDINGQCHKIPFPSTVGPEVTDFSREPTWDYRTSDPPTTTRRPTFKEFDTYVITLVAASALSAVALISVTCVLCSRNRVRRTA